MGIRPRQPVFRQPRAARFAFSDTVYTLYSSKFGRPHPRAPSASGEDPEGAFTLKNGQHK